MESSRPWLHAPRVSSAVTITAAQRRIFKAGGPLIARELVTRVLGVSRSLGLPVGDEHLPACARPTRRPPSPGYIRSWLRLLLVTSSPASLQPVAVICRQETAMEY